MTKHLVLGGIILLLAGCASTGSLESLKPVCDAIGPPIEYNPTNKNSPVHAGPKLADRLDQQDTVGSNLGCKGY